MKPLFYFRYLASLLLIFSLMSSCKKDNFDIAPIKPSAPANPHIIQNNVPNKPDTVNVTATQWVFNNDRSYSADVSSLVYEATQSNVQVVEAYINNNGQDECICGLIDYEYGKLWASYPEHQFMINYISPFGELPFYRLDLTILYTK